MLEWNKRWASVLECADLSHDQQRSLTPLLREHAQQTERKTLADEWEDQWMKTYKKRQPPCCLFTIALKALTDGNVGSTSTAGWTLKSYSYSHSYIFASHHFGGLFWFHIHQGYENEKITIWVLLRHTFCANQKGKHTLFTTIYIYTIHYLNDLFLVCKMQKHWHLAYVFVPQRCDDRTWFSLLCKDKQIRNREVMQRQTFALMMLVKILDSSWSLLRTDVRRALKH